MTPRQLTTSLQALVGDRARVSIDDEGERIVVVLESDFKASIRDARFMVAMWLRAHGIAEVKRRKVNGAGIWRRYLGNSTFHYTLNGACSFASGRNAEQIDARRRAIILGELATYAANDAPPAHLEAPALRGLQ